MTARARKTVPAATPETPIESVSTESPETVVESVPTESTPEAVPAATPETPVESGAPFIAVDGVKIISDNVVQSVETYQSAKPGTKTKIRNAITTAMGAAVMAGDIDLAKAWAGMDDALKSAIKTPSTTVDYNTVLAGRVAALRLAAEFLATGLWAPEGFPTDVVFDYESVAESARTMLESPDDEMNRAASKIATAKITRTTERGSIESHIESAFAGLPVGTKLTVAQIRTRSGAASDGAIAARVWPTADKKTGAVRESTLDFVALGVQPCDIDGTRGMIKVA